MRTRSLAPSGHGSRGGERVRGGVKSGAKSVAAGLENVTVMVVDAVTDQRIVARERRLHRRRVRFPQARAALDIGEEQRDGAGRKVCHRWDAAGEGGTHESYRPIDRRRTPRHADGAVSAAEAVLLVAAVAVGLGPRSAA